MLELNELSGNNNSRIPSNENYMTSVVSKLPKRIQDNNCSINLPYTDYVLVLHQKMYQDHSQNKGIREIFPANLSEFILP